MKRCDFVGLGFCSNDYLALLPEIPIDNKVRMLEHLVQGGGPAATATVAAARLGPLRSLISAGKGVFRSTTETQFTSLQVSVSEKSSSSSPTVTVFSSMFLAQT